MAQYLVAIHHPDNYDPTTEDDSMMHAIDLLNEEMVSAGVRVFVGGLHLAREAKSIRVQPDGKVLTNDGPYLKTAEHMAGFWVLDVADEEAALDWGRKAAVACRASVEVRRFHSL